jgi:hypothetical protein
MHLRQQILKYPRQELLSLINFGDEAKGSPILEDRLTRHCFILLARLAELMTRENHLSINKTLQLLTNSPHKYFRPKF